MSKIRRPGRHIRSILDRLRSSQARIDRAIKALEGEANSGRALSKEIAEMMVDILIDYPNDLEMAEIMKQAAGRGSNVVDHQFDQVVGSTRPQKRTNR